MKKLIGFFHKLIKIYIYQVPNLFISGITNSGVCKSPQQSGCTVSAGRARAETEADGGTT